MPNRNRLYKDDDPNEKLGKYRRISKLWKEDEFMIDEELEP